MIKSLLGLLKKEPTDVDTQENLSGEDSSSIDMLTEEELLKVRAYKADLDAHGLNDGINEIFERYKIDDLDLYVWIVTERKAKVNCAKALENREYKGIPFSRVESLVLADYSIYKGGDYYLIESGILEKFYETLEQDKEYLIGLISSTYVKPT